MGGDNLGRALQAWRSVYHDALAGAVLDQVKAAFFRLAVWMA